MPVAPLVGRDSSLTRPASRFSHRARRVSYRPDKKDLAIAIGDAAIDGVAAHHRNDARVLPRFIFPGNPAIMIEIERVYDIGERRMHIHKVADDQRRPLMTAQDAC